MSQKNVNITIGGRTYPLTISEQEEAIVIKSQATIQTNIDKLKRQYNITDAQDLLAMTALELATRLENITTNQDDNEDLKKSLNELVNQLSSVQ